MRDTFLGDLLLNPPNSQYDDWTDWTVFIFAWLITLLLTGLIAWGILYFVDSSYLSEKSGSGTIEQMYYRPSHYTTTYVKSGNILIPIETFHEETWHICISVGGLIDDITVSKSNYDLMRKGETLRVTYSNGRLWDSMYIKTFGR